MTRARVVHHHLAHRLGRERKKMRLIGQMQIARGHQLEKNLVHERGGVQRHHIRHGQLPARDVFQLAIQIVEMQLDRGSRSGF